MQAPIRFLHLPLSVRRCRTLKDRKSTAQDASERSCAGSKSGVVREKQVAQKAQMTRAPPAELSVRTPRKLSGVSCASVGKTPTKSPSHANERECQQGKAIRLGDRLGRHPVVGPNRARQGALAPGVSAAPRRPLRRPLAILVLQFWRGFQAPTARFPRNTTAVRADQSLDPPRAIA